MPLPVVNRDDQLIGTKERDEMAIDDIYRVSALWITNSLGEILIARRALTKKKGPGMWGPAVAGTVELEETYETNIVKEIQEELGISVDLGDLHTGPKVFLEKADGSYFCQWYFARLDKELHEFTFEPLEVMALEWILESELREKVHSSPENYVPTFPAFLDLILSESKKGSKNP